MKKIITKLCIATILSMVLAGCGGAEEQQLNLEKTIDAETGREMIGNMFVEGLPVVKEPVTLTWMKAGNPSDKSSTKEEKHIIPIFEEATNVIIEFEDVSTNINEKLNLLFAAGQGLPDIFFCWPSESTVANNTTHLFEFTEEILREYAPNITEQIEANVPEGLNALRKADGKIYSLPTGVYAEIANSASGVPLIRVDWLEAVGMEMPTTTDELYEVLKAFKTQDPNGNGKDDEIPLAFCQSDWAAKQFSFAGPWGIAGKSVNDIDNYYRVFDGVVTPMLNQDNFKDYLRFLHKLASEELLDIEGFSLTQAQYKARQNEGVIGMLSTWAADDPAVWQPIPVLKAPGYEGQQVKHGQKGLRTANMNGFMISKSSQHALVALRAWDYLHSDPDLKRIMRDGNPGFLWEKNEDGTATVLTPESFPDGIVNNTELNNTIAFRSMSPAMFGDDIAKPDMTAEKLSNDALRYQYVEMYEPYFPTEFLPERPKPADKITEISFLQTELEAYVNGFFANSVLNGLSDEQWEEHLKQLDNVQYPEWIQLQQDYLDGKF
ncbi:MAG: hypothetical protein ATN31_06625 [Candidatus Epulonipiscioides saccharophilum]|nr:MAG: hypothetical protein ATN31_06625 [Epulopiscium sp. AS2M-Bin001]